MSKNAGATMTVLQHFAELRYRLIMAGVVFLAVSCACFVAAEPLRRFLTHPAGGLRLVYYSPPEALMAQFKLALTAGAVLASPVILYQLVAFIYPALTPVERRICLRTLLGVGVLFCGGFAFSYQVVFPLVLRFLLQHAGSGATPKLAVTAYISLFFSFNLILGAIFQLPLIAWALGRLDLLRAPQLRRRRKYALLIIVILAAIMTPPDPLSQILLALPLLLLYELCIIMVQIGFRGRIREEAVRT